MMDVRVLLGRKPILVLVNGHAYERSLKELPLFLENLGYQFPEVAEFAAEVIQGLQPHRYNIRRVFAFRQWWTWREIQAARSWHGALLTSGKALTH